MEPVVQLMNQYRDEFQEDCVVIRRHAENLKTQVTSEVERYVEKMKGVQSELERNNMFADMSPTKFESGAIMKTFTWAGVMLLAFTITGFLSSMVLGSIVALALNGITAFILAYLVLPAVLANFINTAGPEHANELVMRHVLFGFAVVEGLLTGYILSDLVLTHTAPLAALTPLAIGLTAQAATEIIKDDRTKLIGITIGAGVAMHIVLGFVLGLTFPYILLTMIYSAIGFVTLQVYLKNGEDASYTHIYQLSMLYAVMVSQLLVYGVFGGKPEDMARARDAESHSA